MGMTPALRIASPPDDRDPDSTAAASRGWPWEIWIAFGVALAAGLLALTWPDSTGQALQRMDPVERAALFARTRANVATLCTGEAAFRDACREEARLLRLFPECDAACQALAAAAWPGPTR